MRKFGFIAQGIHRSLNDKNALDIYIYTGEQDQENHQKYVHGPSNHLLEYLQESQDRYKPRSLVFSPFLHPINKTYPSSRLSFPRYSPLHPKTPYETLTKVFPATFKAPLVTK